MALELPHDRVDTSSPVSSGGLDSPVPRLWRGEEEDHIRDKGFRRYASAIDRALSLFDTQLQEWADYISFLGRLLKALQSHPPNICVVPSKSLIARRLAQCLAPSLPSGVHQKALEVYSYIFTLITPTGVARDVSLYLPGLSPVLSFASLTVRSPFLILLRQHILPLPAQTLHPACKALILTLLPGLEDEGSEDFDSTYKLLNDFRNALRSHEESQDGYFWQCFFLATITSPSRRLGALAYLVRELPKLGSGTTSTNDVSEEIAISSARMLTTPEPGLLVRCFAAGLRDDQILIQRGFLDLLVTHLPLHASVFRSLIRSHDLELLMTAASSVVARRDMSLNRRLWIWLLGPEPQPSADDRPTSSGTDKANTAPRTEYFETHGLNPLRSSILSLINADSKEAAERAKPFRICLSLMDRWEIGGLIVPLVFLPAMRSVKRYQSEEGIEKKDFLDVLRSASVFFNGVESGLVWSEINSLIFDALSHNTVETDKSEADWTRKKENLELVHFIVNHFNIREEEMLAVHLPLTTLNIICAVNADASTEIESSNLASSLLNALATSLSIELMDHIPPAVLSSRSSPSKPEPTHWGQNTILDDGSTIIRLKTFYTQHQGDLSASPPPLNPLEMTELFLQRATTLLTHSLSTTYSKMSGSGYSSASQSAIANNARLLILILEKTSKTTTSAPTPATHASHALANDFNNLFHIFQRSLAFSKKSGNKRLPFVTASAIMDVVVALYPNYLGYEQIYVLTPLLVRQLWERLDPGAVSYHVEAVRCIWKLHYALCNHAQHDSQREVEGCLSSLMLGAKVSHEPNDQDAVGCFGVLWMHSLGEDKDRSVFGPLLTGPLFLVLDLLANENGRQKWGEFGNAKSWIQRLSGESLARLFHVLLDELVPFERFCDGFIGNWVVDSGSISPHSQEPVDCSRVVYTMQTLKRILQYATPETWHVLGSFNVQFEGLETRHENNEKASFQKFFASVCVRGMGGVGVGRRDITMRDSILPLNRASLRLLGQLLCDSNTLKSNLEMKEINNEAAKVLCWWLEKQNQKSHACDTALQTENLDVLGKTLRLQTDFGASTFASNGVPPKQVNISLHNEHLQEDRRQNLQGPLLESLPPPVCLLSALQTAVMGALLQKPAQGVMGEWAILVRECVRLNIFGVNELERLAIACLKAVQEGQLTVAESFQQRKDGDRHLDVEYQGIEGEKGMTAKIDILECLIVKAHELVYAEDILMLEAKGRKFTTREERGSDKGFLGGIFSSTEVQSSEQISKDTPITPRQRVQVLITEATNTMFHTWHWADKGKKGLKVDAKLSFHYTSLKLRSRARKLLEILFQREAGPCMETMVALWTSTTKETEKAALQLVNVLDKTQPHNAMPLLFELVHDRVTGLHFATMAWQNMKQPNGATMVMMTADLLAFLNKYTLSLENDAVVEVWSDTAAFLRDVLANPMTYRAILPGLVKFLGLVGEKISKTMRGKSDRVMRREVADLWLRLFTAVFTTNPSAWQIIEDSSQPSIPPRHQPQDIVSVLSQIAISLPAVLHDNTLILQAVNTISSSIIQPTIRAKQFAENITPKFLSLVLALGCLGVSQQSSASAGLMKVFKRDVGEAFNHANFFDTPITLFEEYWKGILKIWCGKDRERIMTDLLSRIAPPTTAGIVFGVGATSARMEADAKTRTTLKRITTLILADTNDAWVASLPSIYAKITELLTATTTSSPSSATRSEIYILLRALITKTSPIHLSFLWPSLNSELESCLSSCLPGANSREAEREREVWDGAALVQGCRLVEQLLDVAPEEWQVGEWTFVRNGVDAIDEVRSEEDAVALMDRLNVELGSEGEEEEHKRLRFAHVGLRFEAGEMGREEVIEKLRPFFASLGRRQFDNVLEKSSGSGKRDEERCREVAANVFTAAETAVSKQSRL